MTPQKGETQRSQHEENRSYRREFGQKRGCSGAAENRLAGAPEGRADACSLAVLQEHDGYQGQAHYYMNDNDNRSHDPTNINKGSVRRKPFCGKGMEGLGKGQVPCYTQGIKASRVGLMIKPSRQKPSRSIGIIPAVA